MRILFITGSLEPGRDGVGDYVARLAAGCVDRGHEVRLAALAEQRATVGEGLRVEGHISMPVWRCRMDALGRIPRRFSRSMDEWQPDLASLHFVPYAWGRMGLAPMRLDALARRVARAKHRHVFLHEPWLGDQEGAAPGERAIGWLQQVHVLHMLRRIRPDSIHTSTQFYVDLLESRGWRAGRLPMFGAVPFVGGDSPPRASRIPDRDRRLVCLHFGTLHAGWDASRFLEAFASRARERGLIPTLVSVGSLGVGAAQWTLLARNRPFGTEWFQLGRLETGELARAFAEADCGVTSVPWNLRQKSSSAAALREHGLNVVVTSLGAPLRGRPHERVRDEDGWVALISGASLPSGTFSRNSPRSFLPEAVELFLKEHAGKR